VYGSGQGEFTLPIGVAVAPNRNVFVTDRHRIQVFDTNGGFITEWGSRGSGNGQFVDPEDIAMNSNSRVYVVDRRNSRMQYFDYVNPAVEPTSFGKVRALFR
jgi:hypothetical protein